MKKVQFARKISAFTFKEMLFTLMIIGALLLIASPNFMPLISKTKAQEAKIQLKHLFNLQEQYRYVNSKYASEFNEIDFEVPKTVQAEGTANYRYEILTSSVTSFKARAEAIVDFDGDGVYNVWEIDENGKPEEIIKD
tara:strand:- start:705854 stop:706267 length:414 start_codon:yes stop_codon:yes gene_type:complete